jgi:chromosome segregation ATPase
MDTPPITESQIQAEVDQLRKQFPQTRDLYREVCVLLFFRYGITPTANKLYQYVRKGSMSAPAEALKRFWLDLRDKSRTRIDHPDLPDGLKDAAGNFMGELWVQAQAAALANFSIQVAEAEEKIAAAQHEAAEEREKRVQCEATLQLVRLDLENAFQRLAESEKKHAIDTSALASLEKSLKSLHGEREQLKHSLEASRLGFSKDLDKVNVALAKAEERYRALEAKSLIEVDRERQHALNVEKELIKLNKQLNTSESANITLMKKLAVLTGQLAQLNQQQKETSKKLSSTERALVKAKATLQSIPKKMGRN